MLPINPNQCPKFASCSAPICPLDADWRKRSHRKGERVCLYLREASKNGGTLENTGYLPEALNEKISQAYPEIVTRHGAIRFALDRAAQQGSKAQRIARLRGEQ